MYGQAKGKPEVGRAGLDYESGLTGVVNAGNLNEGPYERGGGWSDHGAELSRLRTPLLSREICNDKY